MVRELIRDALKKVPLDDVMSDLARLAQLDRYQASWGIEQAAQLVAEKAETLGLRASIARFSADGEKHWWSFRAPYSWTPLVARLTAGNGDERVEIDHATQPFSVATYSAGTPAAGVRAPLVELKPSRGSVVVIGRDRYRARDPIPELSACGALGFVTDAMYRDAPEGNRPGRIELAGSSELFAFSVIPEELERLQALAQRGAMAHASIVIDRTASMPVVSAVLPGRRTDEEVWLTSHLCHPRPGANDNASGVAALLGVAGVLQRRLREDRGFVLERSVRFIWGPEFLGVAAALHQHLSQPAARLPVGVVNLDMVGEDQQLCESPFLLERPPNFRPDLLAPIAEHVVKEVFQQTADAPGKWRAIPFTGFSDHALFAAPDIARPAIQLCHAPDRFNHSGADTLDKVSPLEMRRSIAAGASITLLLAHPQLLPTHTRERIVRAWCVREQELAAADAARYSSLNGGLWAAGLLSSAESVARDMMAQLAQCSTHVRARPERGRAPALSPCWSGPFNARAMLEDVSDSTRSALNELARSDKRYLAVLLQLALRADGVRDRRRIVEETSYALRMPLEAAVAEGLLDALVESRWLAEGTEAPC